MKQKLGILGAIGLLGGAVIAVPLAILKFGIGYASEFKFGDKTVTRPSNWITRTYKAAFQIVGEYLTNPSNPTVISAEQASRLQQDKGSLFAPNIPLGVWQEVLELFEQADCLEARWQLRLPSGDGYITPLHGQSGEDLDDSMCPALLTLEQVQDLVGKPYMLRPSDELVLEGVNTAESAVLTEANFEKCYVRQPQVLVSVSFEEARETFGSAFDLAPATGD